jgi:hypothetical protein
MSIELDNLGFPIDPHLRQLHSRLAYIALEWRTAKNDPELRTNLVQEYHDTLQYLYSVDWDGFLHFEAMLPDEYMPEEFFKRNPDYTT